MDSTTAICLVPRHVLAENFAECPRLVLRGARDALLIEQFHSTQQHGFLLIAKDVKDADILPTERAALTLHRVPDGVAFVAGDERDFDSFLSGLDG